MLGCGTCLLFLWSVCSQDIIYSSLIYLQEIHPHLTCILLPPLPVVSQYYTPSSNHSQAKGKVRPERQTKIATGVTAQVETAPKIKYFKLSFLPSHSAGSKDSQNEGATLQTTKENACQNGISSFAFRTN